MNSEAWDVNYHHWLWWEERIGEESDLARMFREWGALGMEDHAQRSAEMEVRVLEKFRAIAAEVERHFAIPGRS